MIFKCHKWIAVGLLWLAPVLFLLLFYFYPLVSIFRLSFERSLEGLFAPFLEALSSPITWRIIGFTFWQAALSTLLTLILGLPGAYLFAHYNFRGKSLLHALTGIPFLMPTW
jgi:thiamine transport system permease protein